MTEELDNLEFKDDDKFEELLEASIAWREAEAELDKMKAKVFGNGKTDLERKIQMDGLCADLTSKAGKAKDCYDILMMLSAHGYNHVY